MKNQNQTTTSKEAKKLFNLAINTLGSAAFTHSEKMNLNDKTAIISQILSVVEYIKKSPTKSLNEERRIKKFSNTTFDVASRVRNSRV